MKGTEEFILAGNNKLLLGDYKGAIFEFTKAIMASPLLPHAYASRGYAKLEVRDYEGAIYDCQQAINLHYRIETQTKDYKSETRSSQNNHSPAYARMYSIIGIAKLLQGSKDEALLLLHSARLLGSNDAEDIIKSYYRD
jgi:tetratricopeptide (TPR) repeat protein